ncbi:MAG: hypothetical protein ACR2OH_06535, partial [Microthrixaceae bacterium]
MRATRTTRSTVVAFLALSLLAGACSDSESADGSADPDSAGDADTSEGSGSNSDGSDRENSDSATSDSDEAGGAAELASLAEVVEMPGEWAVGTTTVEVTGARDRALPTQVWYPVDPSAAADAEPA